MGIRKRSFRILRVAIAACAVLGSGAVAWVAVPPAPLWASAMPGEPETRVLEWVHTPAAQDFLAFLPRATEIANRIAPEPALIALLVEDVGDEGHIDPNHFVGWVAFKTQLSSDSRLCAFVVEESPQAIGIRSMGSSMCMMKAVPIPRCSLSEIWRSSTDAHPRQRSSRLDISYHWSLEDQQAEWFIRTTQYAVQLSDDCSSSRP